MSGSRAPVLARASGGWLEPVRIGVRTAAPSGAEFARDDLAARERQLGPFALGLSRIDHGDALTLEVVVRNASDREVRLDSVVIGARWHCESGGGQLRFLRNGWQSWSFTGARDLDREGAPPFPSGSWLRGMHHTLGEPAQDRAGWHESDGVTVVGTGPRGHALLAGVVETGNGFGVIYLRPAAGGALVEVELALEVPHAPGQEIALEKVRFALGDDTDRLLEAFGEIWGRTAGARTRAPFQAGWCSWYHFFHRVTEEDLLRNLDALAAERSALPVDVVQLDDGYQRAIGDWLETNAKFPSGLPALAARIREAGFRPGLWTAPFCVAPESRLFTERGDWLLRRGEQPFRALLHGEWSQNRWIHALDPSREDVQEHLAGLFRELFSMGFGYLKLDFLYVVAMEARAADPGLTRAQRLRRGLEAVRRGAGEEAFLLGCGCPLGPAVGVVDGMRIGPDVAPSWRADPTAAVPGIEPTQPSVRSALRSIVHRAWMHRRLWLNDPDCLMARGDDTELTPDEIRTLASSIVATGGMAIFSDDVQGLSEASRARVRESFALARSVDAGGTLGGARAGVLADDAARAVIAGAVDPLVLWVPNVEDAPVERRLAPGELRIDTGASARSLLDAPDSTSLGADGISLRLPVHASALLGLRDARRLAVFCDFDGTFSVKDVGSTIARAHLAERREVLWDRYERGDLTPWEYSVELFDGFAFPRADLDAFLATVDLDAGARDLVEWCAKRGVPFEVLSDGFDHNLERLQEIHGVRFAFASNRLRYEGDSWRIAPGRPNPQCSCGTGTCKRGIISAYRESDPAAFCVHIGNGRVSDLCGALASDLAFAKDTLAPALAERGQAYEPFETLLDVIPVLEALTSRGESLQ